MAAERRRVRRTPFLRLAAGVHAAIRPAAALVQVGHLGLAHRPPGIRSERREAPLEVLPDPFLLTLFREGSRQTTHALEARLEPGAHSPGRPSANPRGSRGQHRSSSAGGRPARRDPPGRPPPRLPPAARRGRAARSRSTAPGSSPPCPPGGDEQVAHRVAERPADLLRIVVPVEDELGGLHRLPPERLAQPPDLERRLQRLREDLLARPRLQVRLRPSCSTRSRCPISHE